MKPETYFRKTYNQPEDIKFTENGESPPEVVAQQTLYGLANSFYASAIILDECQVMKGELRTLADEVFVQRQRELLNEHPESQWSDVAESGKFQEIVNDYALFRRLIAFGEKHKDSISTDLLGISVSFRNQAYTNGTTIKDIDGADSRTESRLTKLASSAKKYGLKTTLYALITNTIPYLPPAYAAAFTVGGENTWLTQLIHQSGVPEYEFLVKLGYTFALIEATTTPLPVVPGVAGIVRLMSYAIAEGIIAGERNHRNARKAGLASNRAKKISTSIALGLPVAIDFGYLAIPIIDSLRSVDVDINSRIVLAGYRLNQLLRKYEIDLHQKFPVQ